MPDGLPAAVHLRLPSDLVFVRPARKMLEGLLQAQGWAEDDVDDAALMITEIVQNAVEHGTLGDGSEWIHVVYHAQGTGLEMEVSDPGSGKDPRRALEHDLEAPVPLDEARGRGLFLVHRLAGTFELSLTEAGGLRVRARKEVSSS